MATNFLEAAGTAGFIASTSVTITLASLGSGAATVSTSSITPGPAGTLAGAQKCHSWFINGGGSFVPTAGGALAGWFLLSTDGGTTFESRIASATTTVMALPRSPDFIIPVYEGGTTNTSGSIKFANGPFRYPYLASEVLIQNLSGSSLSTGTHQLWIGGVADQY